MNETEILSKIVADLDSATASSVNVRTDGGDKTVDPPEVIVGWRASPLPNYAGHRSDKIRVFATTGYGEGGYGGGGYGQGTGDGYERRLYSQMQLDLTLREDDELARNDLVTTVQTYFLPFEDFPEDFDEDTTEWSVGAGSVPEQAFMEPDWYTMVLPVEFVYVKHITETGISVIETITENVEVDQTLTETTTETT